MLTDKQRLHIVPAGASVVEALDALNALSGSTMTLFTVDADGRLTGSLTDGDIRRALLGGASLDSKAGAICNYACMAVKAGALEPGLVARARRKGVELLPVIDADGVIISLIDLRSRKGLVAADAVLMAGGRGERLRPLTAETPKPLLPVGGRAIIDHNVELLRAYGVENIYVTVNYLKDKIISHFHGSEPEVTCVAEPERLGTIGSLSLIGTFRSPEVIVMNADLLTDINLEAMYLKHIETEADITVAVVPYSVSVPYAIVEHSGDRVTGLTEKPTYNYFANAGVYMLRRDVAESVPPRTYLDATDLIENTMASGGRVSLFPVSGRWIDIGSPDDYRHACEIMA